MIDPIERQDAIDAMLRLQAEDIELYGCEIPEVFDGDRAVKELKALPTAEPEIKGKRMMKDTIYRQDAIDIVEYECGEWTGLAKEISKQLRQLSSAEKTGRWIPITKGQRGYSAGDFQCSGCRKPNKCYHLTDYCPNCGAKMENSQ